MSQSQKIAWILLVLLSLIWGSSFILMKLGLEAFSPVELALLRVSIAALTLLPFVFVYMRKVSLRDLGLLFIIGLTGNGIPAFLFAKAETVIPSAIAGVLNALSPVFVLLFAWLFFRKTFPWVNVLGVAIGMAGAILLTLAGAGEIDFSENIQFSLLVVLATICYGVSANLIKEYMSKRNPILVTTFALSTVGLPSLVYLLATVPLWETLQSDPQAWTSLGYIALLASVGTALAVILFNWMLQLSSLIFASSVTYTIPVVALLIGWVSGEPLNVFQVIGFAVILAGVYLVNLKVKK